jgi:hypothetical protein
VIRIEYFDEYGHRLGLNKMILRPGEHKAVIAPRRIASTSISEISGVHQYSIESKITITGLPQPVFSHRYDKSRKTLILPIANNYYGLETRLYIMNSHEFEPIHAYVEVFKTRLKGLLGRRIYGVEEIKNINPNAMHIIPMRNLSWLENGFVGFIKVTAKIANTGETCELSSGTGIMQHNSNHIDCLDMSFNNNTPKSDFKSLLRFVENREQDNNQLR